MSTIVRNTTFKVISVKIISTIPQSGAVETQITGNIIDFAFFRSMKDVIGSGYINLVESLGSAGSFRKIAGMRGLDAIRFEIDIGDGKTNVLFFLIYAIDNVQIMEDKRTFTLRFTEPFGIANSFLRVGMKYSNMKCSEVVEKIGNISNSSAQTAIIKGFMQSNGVNESIFTKGQFDDSTNNINFLVPMWHPLKAMLYFANSACVDSPQDVASCVLFTDHAGKFNLLSMSSLFEGKVGKKEFVYQFSGNIKEDIAKEQEKRYSISQLSMSSIYNIQEFAKLGIFGKRLFEADLYTLAGSQNEKQLGVPQLQIGANDMPSGTYPYKDFTFEEVKSAAAVLYSGNSKILDFQTWVTDDYATPDHLYNIVFYNGTNDKSEKILETIIEPRDLRGDPVRSILTYFRIKVRIPVELELDVGTMFTIKESSGVQKIDEISGQKFVISSVAHYFTLINAYTMVEAFSVPSGIADKPNLEKSFANA